jgi:hypothetical protein
MTVGRVTRVLPGLTSASRPCGKGPETGFDSEAMEDVGLTDQQIVDVVNGSVTSPGLGAACEASPLWPVFRRGGALASAAFPMVPGWSTTPSGMNEEQLLEAIAGTGASGSGGGRHRGGHSCQPLLTQACHGRQACSPPGRHRHPLQ